jgi:hypothetical protein
MPAWKRDGTSDMPVLVPPGELVGQASVQEQAGPPDRGEPDSGQQAPSRPKAKSRKTAKKES